MLRPLLSLYAVGALLMFVPLALDWARCRKDAHRRARRWNATALGLGQGRPYSVDWRWKELGTHFVFSLIWFAAGIVAAWARWLEED